MPPASSGGRIKNPAVHGGLVARADVSSQEQELAEVGQLKIQFSRSFAIVPPAAPWLDIFKIPSGLFTESSIHGRKLTQ